VSSYYKLSTIVYIINEFLTRLSSEERREILSVSLKMAIIYFSRAKSNDNAGSKTVGSYFISLWPGARRDIRRN
jgi:hypothetical protein